jgi:hypothetical protein
MNLKTNEMKYKIIFLFLFSPFCKLSAQDYASMFSTNIKNSDVVVYNALNKSKNETTLFLADNRRIYSYRLKENMTFKDSLSSKRPHEVYNKIVGYSNSDNTNCVYWATDNYLSIFAHSFNYETNVTSNKTIRIDPDTEKIIQFFSENGMFIILSYDKTSNNLKLTTYDHENNVTESVLNTTGFDSNLLSMLMNTSLTTDDKNPNQIIKVTQEIPLFFTESSKKIKSYLSNNNIIITFDKSSVETKLIIIDFVNKTISEKSIEKPKLNNNEITNYSNSYVFDNKIFQISGSNISISIHVKDFNNIILNEINSNSYPDYFNKLNFFEENFIGTSFPLKNKERLLNTLNDGNFGFSVGKFEDKLVITLGKTIPRMYDKDSQNPGPYYIYPSGGLLFSLATAVIFSSTSNSTNKTFANSMNYGRLYTNIWIDESLKPITSSTRDIASEKMRKYLKDRLPEPGQIVFAMNNTIYFGFFDFKEKRFFIRKFTN